MRITEIIVGIFLFYSLPMSFRVNITKGASAIHNCCALAAILFLLLINIWYFRKRDEILSVTEELSRIYKEISDDTCENTNNTKQWIVFLYIFCITVSILTNLIYIYLHFVGDQGTSYIHVIAADLDNLSINNKVFQ